MRRSNAQRAGGWCKPAVTDTRKSSRRSGAELSGAIRTQYGLAVSDDGCPTLLGTRMLVRCRVPVYSNITGIRVVTRYIKSVPSDRDGFFICCGCMGAGLLRIASHKLRERKTTWGVRKTKLPHHFRIRGSETELRSCVVHCRDLRANGWWHTRAGGSQRGCRKVEKEFEHGQGVLRSGRELGCH